MAHQHTSNGILGTAIISTENGGSFNVVSQEGSLKNKTQNELQLHSSKYNFENCKMELWVAQLLENNTMLIGKYNMFDDNSNRRYSYRALIAQVAYNDTIKATAIGLAFEKLYLQKVKSSQLSVPTTITDIELEIADFSLSDGLILSLPKDKDRAWATSIGFIAYILEAIKKDQNKDFTGKIYALHSTSFNGYPLRDLTELLNSYYNGLKEQNEISSQVKEITEEKSGEFLSSQISTTEDLKKENQTVIGQKTLQYNACPSGAEKTTIIINNPSNVNITIQKS